MGLVCLDGDMLVGLMGECYFEDGYFFVVDFDFFGEGFVF